MGLNIIARGGVAPVSAPVYGHLLNTGAMRLAFRPTSENNAFDLSNDEHTLTKSGSPLYTPAGMLVSGNGGVEVSGLQFLTLDSYTILAVVSASNLKLTDDNNKGIAILGDYVSGNSSTMLYIETYNSVSTIRVVFGGYNTTTNAVANSNRTFAVPSAYIVSNSDGTYNIKPIFIAAHIDLSNGDSGAQRIFIPSTQVAPVYENIFSVSGAAAKFGKTAKALGQVNTAQSVKIGYSANGVGTASSKTIKCARVDSVALTQQQIIDQYQATKKWLTAEGVLNISHWI